ncbi:MAG TPA: xanthine dehydrogenase family protein subunit M [Streptosporangiaceae bacterium]
MMKPAPFSYHRARSAEEAVSLLAELGDDAKLIAGGQSLVAMMNFRLARPAALIDISRLADLRYIRADDGGMRIGALALHRDLERLTDPGLVAGFGMLPQAARFIGHYAIRAAGTFGGSIAHADPAAEWCLAALLFDAQIVARGPGGDRVIPATGFFKGFLETELRPDEMIVEVVLPTPWPGAAMHEFSRRHGDFAIVAVAAAVAMDGGVCRDARLVLGGVASTVQRATAAENTLIGSGLEPEVIAAAAQEAAAGADPSGDIHGSAEYRRRLVQVLAARAIGEAAGRG